MIYTQSFGGLKGRNTTSLSNNATLHLCNLNNCLNYLPQISFWNSLPKRPDHLDFPESLLPGNPNAKMEPFCFCEISMFQVSLENAEILCFFSCFYFSVFNAATNHFKIFKFTVSLFFVFTPWGAFAEKVIFKFWKKNVLTGNIFRERSSRVHMFCLLPAGRIIPNPLQDKLFIICLVDSNQRERIQ